MSGYMMTKKKLLFMGLAVGIALLGYGGSFLNEVKASGVPGDPECNVIEYLLTRPEDFSTTSELIDAAAVNNPSFYAAGANASIPFTFFAPTNGAWEAVFTALGRTVAQASKSINLDPVLSYHVSPEVIFTEDLQFGQEISTFNIGGDTITSNLLNFGPYVAGSLQPTAAVGRVRVLEKDIQCGAAVVHVIDNSMIPALADPEEDFGCDALEYIKTIPQLSITSTAFELDEANFPDLYAGAANSSAQYTFFAPTNAAWESAFEFYNFTLEDITGADDLETQQNINNALFYHFVPFQTLEWADILSLPDGTELPTGTGFTPWGTNDTLSIVDGSIVPVVAYQDVDLTYGDTLFCGGIIQIIDTVLFPNFANPPPAPGPESIAQVASDTPDLSILVESVVLSGERTEEGQINLLEALSDPEAAYTVFAPIDEALEAGLAAFGLESVQNTSQLALYQFLTYHVVGSGAVTAAELSDGQVLETLAGLPLTVALDDGEVTIEALYSNATVLIPDITAGNSIVHIVSNGLLPFTPADFAPAPEPESLT